LFVGSSGDIVILDWKRTKTISFHNAFRSLAEPLQHLPASNGWLYALQLNTYRFILETEYGIRVSSMYLAQVHPCLPRAILIEVPRMQEEMQLIVEDQISRGEALSGALPDAPFMIPPPQKEVACTYCARVHRCLCAHTRTCARVPCQFYVVSHLVREARDAANIRCCCFD
jgi:hypothetical protein